MLKGEVKAAFIILFLAMMALFITLFGLCIEKAFSAQHCINIDVKGDKAYIEYSSPDSLGGIAIMLDFGDCIIKKVKWEKSVPSTDLNIVYIDGNQLTAVCFGIFPSLSSGQNIKLLKVYLDQNNCAPDTFSNITGIYTCICGVDAQTIYPDINFLFTDIEDEEDEQSLVPEKFSINTYPNPFNPSMMIKYNVPEKTTVKINVYNIQGQRVASLVDSEHIPGLYYTSWDAIGQASGTYFVRISAPGFTEVRKVILLK